MQNTHDYSQYMRKMRLFLVNDTGGKNNIARHFHYFEGGHKEREKEITIEADQRFRNGTPIWKNRNLSYLNKHQILK